MLTLFNTMNICFYTDCHLGDLLLSNPFIHKICKSNPNETFFQWALYGNELIMGPSNLHYLEPHVENEYLTGFVSGSIPENYTPNNELKEMFIRNHMTDILVFKYNDVEYIAFNVWCSALGCSEDANHTELHDRFMKNLQKINVTFHKNYRMDDFAPYEMLPCLKPTYCSVFDHWNNTYDSSKKRIFIYNFVPRLANPFLDIRLFIKTAAEQFPDYLFILAMYDDTLKYINNVFFCDRDYDIKSVINGNNLLSLAEINNKCDVIISTCSGVSWVWFNRNLESNQKTVLLFDDSDNFKNQMKEYIPKLRSWYRETSKKEQSFIFYLDYRIELAIETLTLFTITRKDFVR